MLGAGMPNLPGDGIYSMFVPPGQTVDAVLALITEDEKGLESMTVVDSITTGFITPASGRNLSFSTAGYTVQGKVKDSKGGIYRAQALLYKQPGDVFTGFADADETGQYIFYHVPNGDYKIAATHPDYPKETAWSAQFNVNNANKTVPDIFMGGGEKPEKLLVWGDTLIADFGTGQGL